MRTVTVVNLHETCKFHGWSNETDSEDRQVVVAIVERQNGSVLTVPCWNIKFNNPWSETT